MCLGYNNFFFKHLFSFLSPTLLSPTSPLRCQERLQHLALQLPGPPPRLEIILLGGPGTGKTYILQKAVELYETFFPQSTQQLAFMNSASRLLRNGKTLHTAFNIPRGAWTAATKTLGPLKEQYLATWRLIQLLCLDEFSMIPAGLLSRCHFRAQQLKQCPTLPWANLSAIFSGDILQLPPVQATSLATAHLPPLPEEAAPAKQERHREASHGLELWHGIPNAILLQHSHRASGSLSSFLAAMRQGAIRPHHWQMLADRLLRPNDPRASSPKFWSSNACVGVLRHTNRVIATLHRAQLLARQAGHRLLVCPAVDSARTLHAPALTDPTFLEHVLHVPNLTTTENLPGLLFLWPGCLLQLEDKLSDLHGLVRGCRGTLSHLLLHPEEHPYDPSPNLPPHVLTHLPAALVLCIPGIDVQQTPHLPAGSIFLEPTHREWRYDPNLDAIPNLPDQVLTAIGDSSVTISRQQFACTNWLACTAYALQGQTLPAMFLDLALPPRMGRVSTSVLFYLSFLFISFV